MRCGASARRRLGIGMVILYLGDYQAECLGECLADSLADCLADWNAMGVGATIIMINE